MYLNLKKYRFHILATLAFIISSHILNVFNQGVIAFLLIFSFGIIHGANDLKLIQKKTQKKSYTFFLKSLLLYVGVVLGGILLFYTIPSFGLFFFVAFSAFHFGEQHLESKINPKTPSYLKTIAYISYGLTLFGLLFTLQWNEVHQVIYIISHFFISKQTTETLFFIGLGIFILTSFTLPSLRKILLFEIILIMFLGLLFSTTTLILGFGVYFVVWHSIPSIKDQLDFLYSNSKRRNWSYFKSSAPYWLFSLTGLLFVYIFFDVTTFEFLPLFFSFLAAITFPHTVVMGWLKLSEEKTTETIETNERIASK